MGVGSPKAEGRQLQGLGVVASFGADGLRPPPPPIVAMAAALGALLGTAAPTSSMPTCQAGLSGSGIAGRRVEGSSRLPGKLLGLDVGCGGGLLPGSQGVSQGGAAPAPRGLPQ